MLIPRDMHYFASRQTCIHHELTAEYRSELFVPLTVTIFHTSATSNQLVLPSVKLHIYEGCAFGCFCPQTRITSKFRNISKLGIPNSGISQKTRHSKFRNISKDSSLCIDSFRHSSLLLLIPAIL